MIKGGGAGRRYLPSVNAEITIAAMITDDPMTLFLPSRRAHSSQKLRLCQTRHPFRLSCAPHSAQKLGWCMVGGTPVLRCGDYMQLSLGGIASSRADPLFSLFICYLEEFATALAFQVRKYFKWENRKSFGRLPLTVLILRLFTLFG